MPTRPIDPRLPHPIPLEFSGKWIAWTSDHSQIVAHSDSIKELWSIVSERGIVDPVYEKVPRADVSFVGTR